MLDELIVVALAQAGDSLAPDLHELAISLHHALLQVLPHFEVEGRGDDSGVEISHLVALMKVQLLTQKLHTLLSFILLNLR